VTEHLLCKLCLQSLSSKQGLERPIRSSVQFVRQTAEFWVSDDCLICLLSASTSWSTTQARHARWHLFIWGIGVWGVDACSAIDRGRPQSPPWFPQIPTKPLAWNWKHAKNLRHIQGPDAAATDILLPTSSAVLALALSAGAVAAAALLSGGWCWVWWANFFLSYRMF
jgi:hypothetical protein